MIKKRGWEAIWEAIWIPLVCGLGALVALLAVAFLGIRFFPEFLEKYNQYFAGIATGLSAIVVAVLVGVTVIYAKRTSEIAKATEEQTKEMREQRWTAVVPVVDLRVEPTWDDEQIIRLVVYCTNVGQGPVLNLECSLDGAGGRTVLGPAFSLAKGEHWKADYDCKVSIGVPILIESNILGEPQGEAKVVKFKLCATFQSLFQHTGVYTSSREYTLIGQLRKMLIGKLRLEGPGLPKAGDGSPAYLEQMSMFYK